MIRYIAGGIIDCIGLLNAALLRDQMGISTLIPLPISFVAASKRVSFIVKAIRCTAFTSNGIRSV
jgi:hypothetical protein